MKKIYVNEEYCINCHLCEVYCAVAHSESKDILKAYKREKERLVPRLVVEMANPASLPVQCRQCEDPPCVEGCISGALVYNLTANIVTSNPDRCVGCWTCVASCPFGAIHPVCLDGLKFTIKCDLCFDLELEMPACVAACPNGALIYEEEQEWQ